MNSLEADFIRYQNFWRRVGAGLLDSTALAPLQWIIGFITPHTLNIHWIMISSLVMVLAPIVYSVYFIAKFGQTPGKMVCGVKVLSVDDSPATVKQAILREFVPVAILIIAGLVLLPAIFNSTSSNSYLGSVMGLIGFIWLWTIAEYVTMITNKRRRAIHDFIAGTAVVRDDGRKNKKLLAVLIGIFILSPIVSAFIAKSQIKNIAAPKVFQSGSDAKVGFINWEIIEEETGAILSRGERDILARDVKISKRSDDQRYAFDKEIMIDQGFSFELIDYPRTAPETETGFGITGSRSGSGFSWEWFNVRGSSIAVKLQEKGMLSFLETEVESRWELGRMVFLSDVSLRVSKFGLFNVLRNKPTWRINIKEGSYVDWPVVSNDQVTIPKMEQPVRQREK